MGETSNFNRHSRLQLEKESNAKLHANRNSQNLYYSWACQCYFGVYKTPAVITFTSLSLSLYALLPIRPYKHIKKT